jgi:transcriptional regulator with XRE-family HTH domain
MEIGDRIRHARVAAGLSQREMATALGVTHGLVGQRESHRKSPGRDNLRRIAELTLTSMDWLLRGVAEADGVLVKDAQQITMLRRFALLTDRQRQNLLELLGAAADVARDIKENGEPLKTRPASVKPTEIRTR